MRLVVRLFLPFLLLAAVACGSDGGSDELAAPRTDAATTEPAADDPAAGSMPAEGEMSAMCVETYSLETLKEREFAFDGAAKSATPPGAADEPEEVTFEVREWFKGGEGDEVTIEASGFSSGAVTSVGGGRKIGERLLVAGDDDILWECGFTQAYDADVAEEWRSALGD